MFTDDLTSTTRYRTLARGSGCGWAKTYNVLQREHARRRLLEADRGRSPAAAARSPRNSLAAR